MCLVIVEDDINKKLKNGISPNITDIVGKYILLLGIVSSMILASTT